MTMQMDPANPVVKLCAEGMQAECEGRGADAHALFLRAWQTCSDDYEACIAAHFVARYQEEPDAMLRWNREALERANAVRDARVYDFYPSLYLNLGKSHEELGSRAGARRCYRLASDLAAALAADSYGETVRAASAAGLERTKNKG